MWGFYTVDLIDEGHYFKWSLSSKTVPIMFGADVEVLDVSCSNEDYLIAVL